MKNSLESVLLDSIVIGAILFVGIPLGLAPFGGLKLPFIVADGIFAVLIAVGVCVYYGVTIHGIDLSSWKWIVFVIGFSLVFVLVIKIFFDPYPIQVDDDVTKEILRISSIAGSGYSPLLIPPFRPIIYDSSLAMISILTGAYASDLMYYLPFVTFPLFALGVFLLAKGFLGDNPRSALAAVFSICICGFFTLGTPIIVLPDSISLIFSLYVIAWYMRTGFTGYFQFFGIVLLLAFVDSGYYYTLFFLLPLVALIQLWPKRRVSQIGATILSSASFVLLIGLLIFYSETFGSTEPSLKIGFETQVILGSYTPLLLGFVLVGVLYYKKNISMLPILIYSLVVLSLCFSQIPFSERAELYARPGLAILASVGLFSIVNRYSKGKRYRQIYAFIMIFLVSSPFLVLPYGNWLFGTVPVQGFGGLSIQTYDSNEAAAGLWLRHQPSGFIVSDLSTSLIMESLSNFPGSWNHTEFFNNVSLVEKIYYFLDSGKESFLSGIGTYPNFYVVLSTRTLSSVELWQSLDASDRQNETAMYLKLLVFYPVNTTSRYFLTLAPPNYSNPSVTIFILKNHAT